MPSFCFAGGNLYVATTGTDNAGCGAIDAPCRTIQYTVTNKITDANGGWNIYLRGGTYQEHDISIPVTKTGTSGAWNSIQSYAGEWAIIDGQHASTVNVRPVIYNGGYAHTGSEVFAQYWLFERIEVTGGGTPASEEGAGIYWNKGPFTVRYCYIHDNVSGNANENPGGIGGNSWQEATIEYNYLYNNGSETPGSGAGNNRAIYSTGSTEYAPESGGPEYEWTWAIRDNVIRYNYILAGPGGEVCIGTKSLQWLTLTRNGTDTSNRTHGDKIHHNICVGTNQMGVLYQQDYVQIYNNIVDMGNPADERYGVGSRRTRTEWQYDHLETVIYNNTVMDSNSAAVYNGYGGTGTVSGTTQISGIPQI